MPMMAFMGVRMSWLMLAEEVRLGLAGALCGLQSLCCNDLRLPQLIIYLRQMDVVLFQTEVRFFFSPAAPAAAFAAGETSRQKLL